MESFNNRQFFGANIHLVPKHAAAQFIPSTIPFPLSHSQAGEQSQGCVSQPSSPLSATCGGGGPFSFLHESFNSSTSGVNNYSADHASHSHAEEDSSNMSPFHGARALPMLSGSRPTSSSGMTGRRISTGSVSGSHSTLGLPLHQSTSEQDLRRKSATVVIASNGGVKNSNVGDTAGDHMRRTSDTFCFDSLRRQAESIQRSLDGGRIVGDGGDGTFVRMRTRTRAISDSSASPRVVSPSEIVLAYDLPSTPERVSLAGGSSYDNFDTETNISGMGNMHGMNGTSEMSNINEDNSSLHPPHSRMPTLTDSSPGGPHTPSPPLGLMHAHHSGAMYATHGAYYDQSGIPMSPVNMLSPHAPLHIQGHSSDDRPHYLGPPTSPVSPSMRTQFYAPPRYSPGGIQPTTYPSPRGMCISNESVVPLTPLNTHIPLLSPSFGPASAHSPSSSIQGAFPKDSAGRNQVDLDRIASGIDTRTTVMIKNVPNKLSDKELIEFIGKVCPRKFDFFYLRMDFQNGE